MSREPRNRAPSQPRTRRFNDSVFVNWSLTDEQKASCKAWCTTLEDMDAAEISLLQSNYKITVSWDDFRQCYTASLLPQGDDHENKGYILTGKGSTPSKARKQALFVHFHVMDGEWSTYSTGGSAEELDD
jgi:hypothetical protein